MVVKSLINKFKNRDIVTKKLHTAASPTQCNFAYRMMKLTLHTYLN